MSREDAEKLIWLSKRDVSIPNAVSKYDTSVRPDDIAEFLHKLNKAFCCAGVKLSLGTKYFGSNW